VCRTRADYSNAWASDIVEAVNHLIAQRQRVAALRETGDPDLAEAIVTLAEIEPIFDHRITEVDALLRDAASRLAADAPADLQGRVLVRLASTQISGEKLDDADATLERAIALLPEGHPGRIEAAALAVRCMVRRGQRQRAGEMVPPLAKSLGAVPDSHPARRAMLTVAMVVAEVMFEDDADRGEAVEMFRDLLAAFGDDDRFSDLAFLAHQALAAGELLEADAAVLHHLRAIIKLTREVGAPSDEIHARIALAGMLTEKGDATSLEEAGRHLQVARDRALEAGLDDLHMLALIGQAGNLARRGRIHGAVDRCLEIARSAVQRHDLLRYVGAVALMSTIYELRGDMTSACRTLLEAEHGLGEAIGNDEARGLIRPHLHGLAGRIGKERFLELLAQIRAVHDIAGDL
jgi:hypothetical protein